jgi:hypothetical protein
MTILDVVGGDNPYAAAATCLLQSEGLVKLNDLVVQGDISFKSDPLYVPNSLARRVDS